MFIFPPEPGVSPADTHHDGRKTARAGRREKKRGETKPSPLPRFQAGQRLPVFSQHLEVGLRMRAGRADRRSLEADVQVAAVQAAPDDLFRFLEDGGVLQILKQPAIAALMLFLGDADALPHLRDLRKSLLAGDFRKRRIKFAPLLVLAARGGGQIRDRVGDDSGRKARGDLKIAALEEFEEAFRVFFLLIRGLLEDVRDLDIPLLAGDAGKVGVTVARLGLPGEGFHEVLFGFGSPDGFHLAFLHV